MYLKRSSRKQFTVIYFKQFCLAVSYRKTLLDKKSFLRFLWGKTVHSEHANFSIDNKLIIYVHVECVIFVGILIHNFQNLPNMFEQVVKYLV